jgi:hypothetical protein
LAKLNNNALHNYRPAVKQAPFLTAFALRTHKAFTSKINQNKRLLIAIILKA